MSTANNSTPKRKKFRLAHHATGATSTNTSSIIASLAAIYNTSDSPSIYSSNDNKKRNRQETIEPKSPAKKRKINHNSSIPINPSTNNNNTNDINNNDSYDKKMKNLCNEMKNVCDKKLKHELNVQKQQFEQQFKTNENELKQNYEKTMEKLRNEINEYKKNKTLMVETLNQQTNEIATKDEKTTEMMKEMYILKDKIHSYEEQNKIDTQKYHKFTELLKTLPPNRDNESNKEIEEFERDNIQMDMDINDEKREQPKEEYCDDEFNAELLDQAKEMDIENDKYIHLEKKYKKLKQQSKDYEKLLKAHQKLKDEIAIVRQKHTKKILEIAKLKHKINELKDEINFDIKPLKSNESSDNNSSDDSDNYSSDDLNDVQISDIDEENNNNNKNTNKKGE